jgi:hypothetical protein
MATRALNLLIFREGRSVTSGSTLKRALLQQLSLLSDPAEVLNALLRAGELECAVEDAGLEAHSFRVLTDTLAERLLHPNTDLASKLLQLKVSLEAITMPEAMTITVPEGFAYYALHPLAFAGVLDKISSSAKRAAVIGIRTIGSTLSAVTAAAARKRGLHAERITVRPIGHPYDRRTEFSPGQLQFVRKEISAGAEFLIVDEGPGLSGSSFLSVGESLVQAGVTPEKVTLIGSHEPNVDALCAPEGPRRWRQFRSIAAIVPISKPPEAEVWIGGGEWRRHFLSSEVRPLFVLVDPVKVEAQDFTACGKTLFEEARRVSGQDFSRAGQTSLPYRRRQARSPRICSGAPQTAERTEGMHQHLKWLSWPASWSNFERLKYLSSSTCAEPRFFKFLGLAHYGGRVLERETQVARAGFGPQPKMEDEGFVSYPLISGRPMTASDLSESVLGRMAVYCAFRLHNFHAETVNLNSLQQMAVHNLQELKLEMPVRLQLEKPVLVDARMQPHEWLLTSTGQMLKTDSGSHGDDHFFPGVSDIAWDLAGAIVEWQMDQQQSGVFLEMYRRASGDDAKPRIANFIKAYTVFRCAFCMMAANAMQGTEEQARLEQAAANYGEALIENAVESYLRQD